MRASLGAAGVLLVGCLAFYIFHREPAPIATATPVATDFSQSEIKAPPSAPSEKAEPSSAFSSPASPRMPAKRSLDAMETAKTRDASPQDQHGVKRSNSAGVEIAEANSSAKDDATLDSAETGQVPDTTTEQNAEGTQDEKSADAGELRFYSETPPYFFLYKPSMKPL